MKRILTFSCFLFVITYAVTPLFGKKYIPTHDGEYHIVRFVEFSTMLAERNFFPRWAPNLNSGYGVPIFSFNYPFPNYIGAVVRLFTGDAVRSFQISLGLGYIVMVFGVMYWLVMLFDPIVATAAAMVTAFVPYIFVDLYVRGSIGEIWATAFLFWSLRFFERKRLLGFSLAYAFLILSHNILALLFTPFLLGYVFLRDKRASIWMLLSLGLTAYFWLPALFESRFVTGLNTVNFRDHFVQLYEMLIPSWGTEFSNTTNIGNKISFQLGIVPILVFLGSFWSIVRKPWDTRVRLWIYSCFVFSAGIFFMLPVSKFVWELAFPLQFIQYPWRLLSFMVPLTAFFSAYWFANLRLSIRMMIVLAAVVFSSSYARPVRYEPRNEAYYMSRVNFTDGTSSMGNAFSTIWSPWKKNRPDAPAFISSGDATVVFGQQKPLVKTFTVHATTESVLTVNALYFPGWIARVNGRFIPLLHDADGLISIRFESGTHDVTVVFSETPLRKVADGISLVSLFWVFGYSILKYSYAYRYKRKITYKRS